MLDREVGVVATGIRNTRCRVNGKAGSRKQASVRWLKLRTLVVASFLILPATYGMGQITFTHDVGTIGLPGSDVFAAPDEKDIFFSPAVLGAVNGVGSNVLIVDNSDIGLVAGDTIDALAGSGLTPMDGTGVFDPSWVFSVYPLAVAEAGTPINTEFPFDAGDLYRVLGQPLGHGLLNREFEMGLDTVLLDSIDGLEVDSAATFGFGDRIHFSLAPGSPTLAANGWSPADILTVAIGSPASLTRAISAANIGLLATDNVDGLILFELDDENGDNVLDGPNDYVFIFFSVDAASTGVVGSDVSIQAAGNGADGDIYWSNLAGDHTLGADNVLDIRLIPADGIDALSEFHSAFGDPPFIGPAGFPPVPPPPNDPPYPPCIAGFYVGFCGAFVPSVPAKMGFTIKLCDDMGNRIVIDTPLICVANRAGAPVKNAGDRANDAMLLLQAMKVDKPPLGKINVFGTVGCVAPAVGGFNPNLVQAAVCVQINPALTQCNWIIDKVCVRGSAFTRAVHTFPFNDPLQPPWFRVVGLCLPAGPIAPGVFRASFSDGDPFGANILEYTVPFSAGANPLSILGSLEAQINADGGDAAVVNNKLWISRIGVEPIVAPGVVAGPFLEEWGAVDNSMIVVSEWEARDTRSTHPRPAPTVSAWALLVLTLLMLTAGTVILGRRRWPKAA